MSDDKIEIQILLRTVQRNWPDAVGMGKTQCGKVYIDMNGLPLFDNQLWWLNANYKRLPAWAEALCSGLSAEECLREVWPCSNGL